MFPPPQVQASELRPSRGWYVVAAVFAFIVIVAGGVGFAFGIVHAIKSVDIKTKFAVGQPAAVTYDTVPPRQAIFASTRTQAGEPQAECTVRGPGDAQVPLAPVTSSITLTLNNVSWHEIAAFEVPSPGTYTVSCTSQDATGFGVGKYVRARDVAGGVLGGLAALGLAGIGVLISVIIAIVTGVRRGRYRRRLWAERQPRRY